MMKIDENKQKIAKDEYLMQEYLNKINDNCMNHQVSENKKQQISKKLYPIKAHLK